MSSWTATGPEEIYRRQGSPIACTIRGNKDLEHAFGPELTRRVPILAFLSCVLGVSLCTWISFSLGLNLSSVGFLYLVFVVLAAVYGGFLPATFVSVVSVGCLDYFFSDPLFSFRVGRFSDWVELGSFEFTAVVVSQLSSRSQVRALEAITQRRDTNRLYETARSILLIDEHLETGNRVAALIQREFDLASVVLFDALSDAVYQSCDSMAHTERSELLKKVQGAYLADLDTFVADRQSWFCVLRLGVRPVGAIALCGTGMSKLNANAVASLCAIALERARTLDDLCQTQAAREAEKLRSAVLDALAHKFKTPLTVVRTAVAGLTAAAELSQLQTELVTLIDQEARRLNDLADRLLGAPELDPQGFQGQFEPVLLSRLVKTTLDELDLPSDRRRFRTHMPDQEPPVLADFEMILTALAQIVDNALKYSVPESPIDIDLVANETAVVMTVRSVGLVVASSDRERIFERFYRAEGARSYAHGTGLGLSIVRTIAADHHGQVWAEGQPESGTTFFLSLPLPEKELA